MRCLVKKRLVTFWQASLRERSVRGLQLLFGLALCAAPSLSFAERILILMPDLKPAQQIYGSLSDELAGEYEVEQFYVDSKTNLKSLADKITTFEPTAVVLMNNPTVGLYRRYQAAQPEGTEFPPAIAVMVSFLEKEIQGLQNATGIFFEIPSTTAFVNMRQISRNPIEKVGVLVRETFSDYIDAQAKLAAPEQFEIVTRKVREGSTIRDIRLGLRQLIRDEGVDALWVLNDNVLLTERTLVKGWLPETGRYLEELPVIVGVELLASRDLRFGSYAVIPDLEALGVQAANLLFELEENDWQAGEWEPEMPLAVQQLLNLNTLSRNAVVESTQLEHINHIIE